MILALLLVAAFGGLGTWGYVQYAGRPRPQITFFDVPLHASRSDVRFAKGEPSIIPEDNKDEWIYRSADTKSFIVVRFRGDNVRYVEYMALDEETVHPYLQDFKKDMEIGYVIQVLGEPSHVSTTQDGLQKILSFDKYNTFYQFEKAKVVTYGIFDPKTGPMEFPKTGLITK